MTLQSRTVLTAPQPSRRTVVGGLFGLGAAALAAPSSPPAAAERRPTPRR